MKMKSLSLVLCLVMMFGLVAPFVSAPSLVVQTDKITYQIGDNLTVNVSGGTPNSIVMVQFNNPSSDPKWVVQGVLSSGGSYTYTLKVPYSWEDGTWTVRVKDQTASSYTTFTVSSAAPQPPAPAPAPNEVEKRFYGAQTNAVVDALATMDVKVKLNTTGDVSVHLIEYETNPHPEAPKPKNMLAKYIDISVSNPDAITWPIYIEIHYTDEMVAGLDESSLVLYFFFGGSWHVCSSTGVNTDGNFVWAYMTREEAVGSPLSMGGRPTVAQFTYSNLQISPTEVNTGVAVTVQVTVKNIGDTEGTATVDLYINAAKEQTMSVTLQGGVSTTVSFSVSKTTAGTYTVKVGDQTGSFKVVKPLTPASFTYTGLTVSPADVAPGTEATVSVTVKNTGELSGTYSAELKLDGTTKETKTGILAGGASATVTFKVSSQAEGTHAVQVGTQTGSFKVTKPVTPPPTAPDYTWYIIGAVAVIVIVVAVYLLMRRKPQGVAP